MVATDSSSAVTDSKAKEKESNTGDSEQESSSEEESVKQPYIIPKRSTRGKRLVDLDDEEAEADNDFWGQKAWQEVSEDEEIQSDHWSTDEKEDQEDSDFDALDEAADERARAEEAAEAEAMEKKRQRSDKNKLRKGVYVDPALKSGSVKRKATAPKSKPRNVVIQPSSREMRTSTKVSSIATGSLVRGRSQQQLQRGKQLAGKEGAGRNPLVRLTQQQLLEEAARTEVANKRSLDLMLMMQEEKKRERVKANTAAVPRIIYFSSQKNVRRGPDGERLDPIKQTVTFTGITSLPPYINSALGPKPTIPEPLTCSVTGLPAKYRDPLTGIPYRTIEAFKVLRARKGTTSGNASKKQKTG